jgi:hypothetical protein
MAATFGSPAQTVFSVSYDCHVGNGTPGRKIASPPPLV